MGRKRPVADPSYAGSDVGECSHYEEAAARPARTFGSRTEDLEELAAWLLSCGVRIVELETTGDHWTPLLGVLDRAGFEVQLVDRACDEAGQRAQE